jgi:hypothetical protein
MAPSEYDDSTMDIFDDALQAVRWVAFVAPLIILWIAGFWDLTHRDDLSVLRKSVWAAFFILTLYVGLAMYFATRPVRPPAGKGDTRSVPRASRIVADLEALSTAHRADGITEEAFLSQKRELLGLSESG